MLPRPLIASALIGAAALVAAAPSPAEHRHSATLSQRHLHPPVARGECTACHALHFPTASPSLTEPVPALCLRCHEPFRGREVHAPVAQGACGSCHQSHGSSVPSLLKGEREAVCVGCHPDRKGGAHGKVVLRRDCTSCHDPHAAEAGALLRDLDRASCSACHPSEAAAAGRHGPEGQDPCRSCHDPHAANPSPPTPCSGCHADLLTGTVVHAPAGEGCSECHAAHGPSAAGLLRAPLPDLCLRCHPERSDGRHGALSLGTDCASCHRPHSADRRGLLSPSVSTTPCATCHGAVAEGTVVHTPVASERCDRCHDPHAQAPRPTASCADCHATLLSGRYRHEAAEGGCGDCHLAHAGPSPDLLREPVETLCLPCHDGKTGGRHGRVLLGSDCTRCHDPHSAMLPGLLRSARSATPCQVCHEGVLSGPVVHFPVPRRECRDCHDPHGDPPVQTPSCTSCHARVTEGAVVHPPVEEGCRDCHASHSAQLPHLLLRPQPDLCLDCHPEREGGRHGRTTVAGACGECHDPHAGDGPNLLRGMEGRDCVSCHGDRSQGEHRHSALGTTPCAGCHQPHATPPQMPPTPCETCHRGLSDRSPLHGAPSRGRCLECHDPHAAPNPNLMKETAFDRDACLACHASVARALAQAGSRHDPASAGPCSDCHTSHVGRRPYLVERHPSSNALAYDRAEYGLCYSCHEADLAESVFTLRETAFRNQSRNLHYLHVVREGRKGYSCTACHDPHAAPQEMLLRAESPGAGAYGLKVRFRRLPGGGSCETNCHNAKEYAR